MTGTNAPTDGAGSTRCPYGPDGLGAHGFRKAPNKDMWYCMWCGQPKTGQEVRDGFRSKGVRK